MLILRPRLDHGLEQRALLQHFLEAPAQIVPRNAIALDLVHVRIVVTDVDVHPGDVMPCDRKRAAAAVAAALDLIAVCVERYRDDVFTLGRVQRHFHR